VSAGGCSCCGRPTLAEPLHSHTHKYTRGRAQRAFQLETPPLVSVQWQSPILQLRHLRRHLELNSIHTWWVNIGKYVASLGLGFDSSNSHILRRLIDRIPGTLAGVLRRQGNLCGTELPLPKRHKIRRAHGHHILPSFKESLPSVPFTPIHTRVSSVRLGDLCSSAKNRRLFLFFFSSLVTKLNV